MSAPIDLDRVWQTILAGEDRDDGHLLHASDLVSCDYSTWLRINGTPELAFDDDTLATFARGHMLERYVAPYLTELEVEYNVEVEYRGIVGHIDFLATFADGTKAVIDTTTTAWKEPEAKYPHILKSAFYAVAVGAEHFCEWVFCFGFGGVVKAQKAFWFDTNDYREDVEDAIDRLLRVQTVEPEMEPNPNLGYNKCGKLGSKKSYCQSRCPRNEGWIDREVEADGTLGNDW